MADIDWGILGTGRAAKSFAKGLARLRGARLVAVGSRDGERAASFGARFGADRTYGSYEDLVADPGVDVVYVATPHARHCTDTLLALEAGKPVLCEKPLAINAVQAEAMVRAAGRCGLFLMEAMWSRFLPSFVELGRLIGEGDLGTPRLVRAECCWRNARNPLHRLFDPTAGGGALLDLGVYGVHLALMVFGEAPETVSGRARIGDTGVDEHGAAVLGWRQGGLAVVITSLRAQGTNDALIAGSSATVRLEEPFWRSSGLIVEREGEARRRMGVRFRAPGYQYEAEEVSRCLRESLPESPSLPLARSLEAVRVMDRIRECWGLQYPVEIG